MKKQYAKTLSYGGLRKMEQKRIETSVYVEETEDDMLCNDSLMDAYYHHQNDVEPTLPSEHSICYENLNTT
jgi:hypothetical protein